MFPTPRTLARSQVDEKTSQLTAVSQLSALIAGFSMVVLVELSVPEGTPDWLVALCVAARACCRAGLHRSSAAGHTSVRLPAGVAGTPRSPPCPFAWTWSPWWVASPLQWQRSWPMGRLTAPAFCLPPQPRLVAESGEGRVLPLALRPLRR